MIRPEVQRLFWRYAEPICILVIGLILFGVFWRMAGRGEPLGWVGVAITISVTFWLLRASWLRLKLSENPQETSGQVFIEEARILFIHHLGNQQLDRDDLIRVEIMTTNQGPVTDDVFWMLIPEEGPPISIPSTAIGAEGIIDLVASLPGAEMQQVINAMGSTENRVFLIWQRDTPPSLPTP